MRASYSYSVLSLLVAFVADALVLAAPSSSSPAGQTLQLARRDVNRTAEEWGSWAKTHREGLTNKYGGTAKTRAKRGSGTNLLVNQNADSSYFGSIAVGTPLVAYDVILDTGSADLWLADSSCTTGCSEVQTYDTSESSTYVNLTTSFSITYGSGSAAGTLAQDVVQMAGFSVSSQTFATVDQVSDGLLTAPVSGLMGLAFQSIASSGATPFWQNLVESGAWDSPVMSFQLTRYLDQPRAESLEPGGTFTMGFVNDSLYTGDIDFVDIEGTGSYWLLEVTELSVSGTSISLTSGSSSYAAIDTGTTLVGGPSSIISELYAAIPSAQAGTGDYEGYYIYPCSESVQVNMAFGGRTWSIDPADFELAQLSTSQCLGAFFELDMGSSAPSWIVGDTFLKNVYSVFRYDPASIGFANLSTTSTDANGDLNAVVPTPTLGSVAAAVTATGRSGSGSSSSNKSTLTIPRVEPTMLMTVLGLLFGILSVV